MGLTANRRTCSTITTLFRLNREGAYVQADELWYIDAYWEESVQVAHSRQQLQPQPPLSQRQVIQCAAIPVARNQFSTALEAPRKATGFPRALQHTAKVPQLHDWLY